MTDTVIVEYLWLGGKNELRSKTRVLRNVNFENMELKDIPKWNYDGSSTGQCLKKDKDTEIVLIPIQLFRDPFRRVNGFIALCDTEDNNGVKIGPRSKAVEIFDSCKQENPWFGLEQEYFIFIKGDTSTQITEFQGPFYCSSGFGGMGEASKRMSIERSITEKHLEYCLFADINISGMNAEVACHQWEFQVGPNLGISAADDLYVARYILERIAEEYDCMICYHPKICPHINGSGCHVNFSTESTRSLNGVNIIINDYLPKLEKSHSQDVNLMGEFNHLRLTGLHETSSMDTFSYGIGTRHTSIRIGNESFQNKCGYFEDRRPSSNMEPYLVTSLIFNRCVNFIK
jgi:glutamine synthetase